MEKERFWTFHGDKLAIKLEKLERFLGADVIVFSGTFFEGLELTVKKSVEKLHSENKKNKTLYIILTTNGGSAKTIERCVHIIRHYYTEVNFIVPDYAYSAGTLFCLSGNKIFMDYYSVLGPIDPQVRNEFGYYVPAQGYLQKANSLMQKSKNEEVTQAELTLLRSLDYADLYLYEQAQSLSVSLAKQWIIDYSSKHSVAKDAPAFKNIHKFGFAEKVGKVLSDSTIWLSHVRPLHKITLEEELQLSIEDLNSNTKLDNLIKSYYYELDDIVKGSIPGMFLQSRIKGEIVARRKGLRPRHQRKNKGQPTARTY